MESVANNVGVVAIFLPTGRLLCMAFCSQVSWLLHALVLLLEHYFYHVAVKRVAYDFWLYFYCLCVLLRDPSFARKKSQKSIKTANSYLFLVVY